MNDPYIYSYLNHYLTYWAPLGYLIVFLGMIIEGDLIVFTSAFLTHARFFNPLFIFADMLIGVLLGDLFWYWLGEHLKKTSPLQRLAHKIAGRFDEHTKTRSFHTIFISKFITGVHHAILMRAGALGVDKREFIKSDIVSSTSWILIVGSLGYFSSASFSSLRHLKQLEMALLIAIVGFLILERIITWLLERNL